jgi:transposase InsO family protein
VLRVRQAEKIELLGGGSVAGWTAVLVSHGRYLVALYNLRRPHQALRWRTPDEAYLGQLTTAAAQAAGRHDQKVL